MANTIEGLSQKEQELVALILKEYSDTGTSKKYNELFDLDWEEIPVDIDTFLHDQKYLGNGLTDLEGRFTIFPYWQEKLKEIFPTNTTTAYNTIIFTGAIGLGKSMIACICLLYMLYRLLCLRDPYLYYGMQPIDKLSISLMNITIENAKGVALDKINLMILSSSWFLAHGEMRGTTNLEYVPNKHIELITASSNNQIIGRAILANFTDEVNFGLTSDVEKLKKKLKLLISLIDARMKSRFMRGTYLPTLNIIASSKNSDLSFLEDFIETKRKNESKNTLIVDEPQWVVDSRKDSPVHFYVAIGNKFLANELLDKDAPDSLVEEYAAKGYTMLSVPIGYYESFQDNIDGALTDIAGIATASSLKYISGVRWNEIKTDSYSNPFTQEIIEVGNAKDDFVLYSDFFDINKVPLQLKHKPLYIHLDMSVSGDKTGIAGVFAVGKRAKLEDESSSKEMFYLVAFHVAIKAPKGYEISFDKNRAFIRWLKLQGFKVAGISSDTFQSSLIRQQLEADGFNVTVISVDRLDSETKTLLQYAYFKSTIYDRRLTIYKDCTHLTNEVLGLERESDGHILHPELGTLGCFTGDTKISLVDGRELTMLQLVNEFNSGKRNFVYSFNEEKKVIEPKLIENAWCTIKCADLVEVTLDSGESVRCTPNHRFMLRDGSYKEAKDLSEGDSLMPLYRKYPDELIAMHNYRMYYEPIEDAWHYEHRKFAQEILDEKYLVHHKDCNPLNNSPDNLIWCSKSAHLRIHAELSTGSHSPEAEVKRAESIKLWHKANRNTETYIRRSRKLHDARLKLLGETELGFIDRLESVKIKKELQHLHAIEILQNHASKVKLYEEYIQSINDEFGIDWYNLSLEDKDKYSVKYHMNHNPETKAKISESLSKAHEKGVFDNAEAAIQKCNEESRQLKKLIPTIDLDKFEQIFGYRFEDLPKSKHAPMAVKYRRIVGKTILNHKVVGVKVLETKEDVYDLTVQDNHNFALSIGVFVHNSKDCADAICGAMWNASLHADEFAYEYGEDIELMTDAVFDNLLELYMKNITSLEEGVYTSNEANTISLGVLDGIMCW